MSVWERQSEETPKQYEAFACYRDMGPSRSLQAVGRELGKSRALMERWSAANGWVERARALDARDDAIRLEAVELHDLGKAADRARRTEALRSENLANEERAAAVEAKYLDRAERLIDELPLVQKTTVREEDGKPVVYVIQPATKNAVLDAARLHKIATRGEPSKVDLRTYDLTQATEEQLERIAAGEDPARVLSGGA